MKRNLRLLAALMAATGLVLSFAFVACGGSDSGDVDEPTAAADHADDDHEAGAIHISLTEWAIVGEDGEAIPVAEAGEVVFEVHNDGATVHELAVIRTDTDAGDLPLAGTLVDEDDAGELIGRTNLFAGGGIEILTVDLEPGSYALICNVASHYESGMFASLVVE